ncbi:MAG: PQQ-dependent sugar dehydrogenase, partial [Pedobacter sp.]
MEQNLIKSLRFIIITTVCLVLVSCSKKKAPEVEPPVEVPTNPPASLGSVETNPANSSYRPAFTGQTRIGRVTTTTATSRTIVTSSLTAPWGIVVLPDGRFLVNEKAGRMRIVTATGNVGSPINGIPTVNSSGQGGLLGLCLDPDFSTNRMVYWSYSEPGTGGNVSAVAKGRLAN